MRLFAIGIPLSAWFIARSIAMRAIISHAGEPSAALINVAAHLPYDSG
jgi:hypothetical protein